MNTDQAPQSAKERNEEQTQNDAQEGKKKKKSKKNKNLAYFMEDEKEAKEFEKEQDATDKDIVPKKKVKKSVGFNMAQNEVKEFEKNSRIIESSGVENDNRQEDVQDNIQKEKERKKQ